MRNINEAFEDSEFEILRKSKEVIRERLSKLKGSPVTLNWHDFIIICAKETGGIENTEGCTPMQPSLNS